MGFKENLRDELFYKGISLKELSKLTGISQGSISNYLKEKSSIPSADVAVKIATALNVSVEYLVSGKQPQIRVKEYSAKIRYICNKLEKISEHDMNIVISLIEIMVAKK